MHIIHIYHNYMVHISSKCRFLTNPESFHIDLVFVLVLFMAVQMLENKCATLIVAAIFSLLRQEDWLICLKEDVFLLNIAGKEWLYWNERM